MSSVNLSALSSYIEQFGQELYKESVLKGNTIDKIYQITGVKYKQALHPFTSTLVVTDQTCGTFAATGSVVLGNREVEVVDFMAQEELCAKDFEDKYLGKFVKGSNGEIPQEFLTTYFADKIDKIQRKIEDNYWNHSTNGLVYHLTVASASTANYATASGALTINNAITVIDGMIDLIPEAILDREDLKIRMSYANYRTLTRALRNSYINSTGVFTNTGDEHKDGMFETYYPGTNIKIVATTGLQGSNKIFLSYDDNYIYATDATGEENKFEYWYDQNTRYYRFRSVWKMGAQVFNPQYVVVKWS